MWRTAVLLTALSSALLPVAVLSDIVDNLELFKLEQDLEAAQGHRLLHHRHHRRHHMHRRDPFLHQRISSLLEAPAGSVQGGMLAGRHPAVARKLEHMEQAMQDVDRRQRAAAQARDNLEGDVKEAGRHMSEVAAIKNQLARTQAKIRSEERKLRKLQEDRLRVDKTHLNLASSLHHIMGPKIEFAEARVQKSRQDLLNLEDRATEWKRKEGQFHAASLAMLEERRRSKAHLEAAQAAETKAQQEQLVAERDLLTVKKRLNFDVEGYRYSKAKARAAASKKRRGEQATKQAETSEKRLTSILNMEQRRVDESMAVGKDRLMGKIRELENAKKQSLVKLTKLKHEYSEWQGRSRALAAHIAATKDSTSAAARDYDGARQVMLGAAEDQVVQDAESDSDWAWDDWPGTDGQHDAEDA